MDTALGGLPVTGLPRNDETALGTTVPRNDVTALGTTVPRNDAVLSWKATWRCRATRETRWWAS